MDYLIIFFSSLTLTIFVTPYLINFLERNGVVDKPDKRRVNTKITPRMGGIVIFLIVLVQVLTFYEDLNTIRFLLLGSFIIAICGILDDIASLKWYVKFVAQFITAVIVIYSIKDSFTGIHFFGIYVPPGLDYALLFFFIIGVINSINLMDGLDGLVSGYSLSILLIIISLSIIRGNEFVILFTAALIGSLLGFLKFNAYPAKIFLGDTGALLLGYFLILGTIYTSLNYSETTLDLTFPTLVLAVPIVDTIKVILVRLVNGKHPFLPDKSHLHHVIFGNKITHKSTVFLIHGFNLLFISLALNYLRMKNLWITAPLFFLLVLLLFNLKTIARYIKTRPLFISIYNKSLQIYAFAVRINKKPLIGLSTLAAIGIILTSFPQKLPINSDVLLFLAGIGIILLFISVFQREDDDVKNHIFFYFNMAIFFILYNLQTISGAVSDANTFLNWTQITRFSFIFLSTLVILLLAARPKIISTKKIFLSGMDLIIIVIIGLCLLLQSFITNQYLDVLSTSLKMALVIYLWYRLIVELNRNVQGLIFYSSFGLSFITILYLLLN